MVRASPPSESLTQAQVWMDIPRGSPLHKFLDAYITAALWATNDESDERGGVPLDENYGFQDIHPETLLRMKEECQAFLAHNRALLGERYEQGGHDFFLTRCGHGCGFLDVPDWPEEDGEILTRACKAMGEVWLSAEEDGLIYQS